MPAIVKEKFPRQLVKEMCCSLRSIADNLTSLRKDTNVPIIFVLDCVYTHYSPSDDLLHGGWENVRETSNLATLCSITKAPSASDGLEEAQVSPFTEAFIENIRREITLEDLHRAVLMRTSNIPNF